MKYIGESCPVCNNVFKDGDDIVVCPECGTPAHRECWKKDGKCINEDKHGEFVWTSSDNEPLPIQEIEADASVSKLCPNCSARNDENATVCKNCGLPIVEENRIPKIFTPNPEFNQTSAKTEGEIDGVKISKIINFVQVNYPTYIEKFTKISNKKVSFNWSAFLFNPYWFFFRKLYYVGGIFLGIQLLISVLLTFLMPVLGLDTFMESYMEIMSSGSMQEMQSFVLEAQPHLWKFIVLSAIMFIPNIISGFIADRIYKRSAFKNIKK